MTYARILVVEDDSATTRELQSQLTALDYVVADLAPSGVAALRKVEDLRPDLVLMDVVIKGAMDGIQTAGRIRDQFDIPVVFLTSASDEVTLLRARLTEPYGYILKPFDQRMLRSTIEIALYKHRAEKRLRESERRFRELLENIDLVAVTLDMQGQITFCNDFLLKLTGWQDEGLTGRNWFETFIPAERSDIRERFAQGIQRGSISPHYEHEIVTRVGQRRLVAWNNTVLRDPHGEILGTASIGEDITERRQAEAVLEQYRLLFEHSRDVFLFVRAEDYRIVEANTAAVEAYGYARQELASLTLFDLHPADAPALVRDQMQAAASSGVLLETVHQRKDGSRFPVEVNSRGAVIGGERILLSVVRDTTARKRGEKALRESEERFRRLTEHAQDIIYRYDLIPEQRISYINPASALVLGYAPDEFYADPYLFFRIIHPDDWQTLMSVGRSGVLLDIPLTLRWMHKDGTPVWIENSPVPVFDEAGNLVAVEGIARDVTARRQAEEAEHEQRALAEALRDTAAALTSTLNLDEVLDRILANIDRVVPSDFANIMLIDAQQGIAYIARSRSYRAHRLDDFASTFRGQLADMPIQRQVIDSQQPVVIPDTLTHPDWPGFSEAGWVRSYVCAPICVKGEVAGFLNLNSATPGFFTRAHAERLQALADQASLAIDNARLYAAAREAVEVAEALRDTAALLSSTLSLDEVFDRMLDNLGRVVPHDATTVRLVERGVVRVVRHRNDTAEGSEADLSPENQPIADVPSVRVMNESGQAILIADTRDSADWIDLPGMRRMRSHVGAPIRLRGEVVGFISADSATPGFYTPAHAEHLQTFANQAAVAIENARLYQLLQDQIRRFKESQARLIQSERIAAMGRLTASITHEINNPLQAVHSCLSLIKEELAEKDADMEEVQHDLGIAGVEIERIASIVRRLREFFRPIREGKQPIHLRAVVHSVLELTDKQMRNSRVRVEWKWFKDLPPIETNPDRVKQVILNLVLNAIDAMPKGGILQVACELDDLSEPGSQTPQPAVRLQIGDTGDGIPPDILPHIFEPFFTTKESGSGLGLAISDEIVQALGGELSVASQVGSGTTFTIRLPVGSVG